VAQDLGQLARGEFARSTRAAGHLGQAFHGSSLADGRWLKAEGLDSGLKAQGSGLKDTAFWPGPLSRVNELMVIIMTTWTLI
jgi:hypothetical protein